MPCDCCCKNVLNLCKIPVCGEVDFGITAQQDGTHQLVVNFLETEITVNKSFSIGDQIVFDVSRLNEDYTFLSQLFAPDGKQILIRKDNVDYDCISFQTVMAYSITEMTSP